MTSFYAKHLNAMFISSNICIVRDGLMMKKCLQSLQICVINNFVCSYISHLHSLNACLKSSSMTTHLRSLHWLPVKVRSSYKIACLCYHCHSSTAQSYVADMLHIKPSHTRITRSSSYTMPLLNRPAHSRATLGDRSFFCFLFCLELYSKRCQVCPITVII